MTIYQLCQQQPPNVSQYLYILKKNLGFQQMPPMKNGQDPCKEKNYWRKYNVTLSPEPTTKYKIYMKWNWFKLIILTNILAVSFLFVTVVKHIDKDNLKEKGFNCLLILGYCPPSWKTRGGTDFKQLLTFSSRTERMNVWIITFSSLFFYPT